MSSLRKVFHPRLPDWLEEQLQMPSRAN